MASIAIDKDGVCVDLTSKVLSFLAQTFPKRKEEFNLDNVKSFNFHESFEGVKEAVEFYFKTDQAFRDLKLIEGSVEAIKELHQMGHHVFICTAPVQSPNCFYNKADWFFQNLPFLGNNLVITNDKTIIKCDYLIDDHPSIHGVNKKPEWKQILFDQPWNRHKKDGDHIRIKGWNNVLDYFWDIDR